MGFAKGYNRDFAQAVNDLVPDVSETEKVEEVSEAQDELILLDDVDETDMLEGIEEINKIDDAPVGKKEKISKDNMKAAVTAAITKQSDDKVPEKKIGKSEVKKKETNNKEMKKDTTVNDKFITPVAQSSDIEEIKQESAIPLDEEIKGEMARIKEIQESEVSYVAGMEIKDTNALAGNPTDNTAYITGMTTINGDLETTGNIDIIGRVNGNVRCEGKLVIGGHIYGDIYTKELYANEAKIEGEIEASDEVVIGAGTVLVGNIIAGSAMIAGAVNGDIDVHGPVIVDSTAVIIGNIKSKSVQINNGAVVEGFCSQCYSDVDAKSYFPTQLN